MLKPEHKAYIDSFKHTSDPITRLIELLTPRYGSSQFLMSELEDRIENIPDAKTDTTSKNLMESITKIKLIMDILEQNNLEITVAATEKIACLYCGISAQYHTYKCTSINKDTNVNDLKSKKICIKCLSSFIKDHKCFTIKTKDKGKLQVWCQKKKIV